MTRQRITGSLVLLLVAVILLPAIFDGQGAYQAPPVAEIPPAPALPEAPQSTANRPEILADSEAIRVEGGSRSAPLTSASLPLSSAAQRDGNDNDTDDAESPATEQQEPPAAAVAPPQLDSRGLPQAWSVRLGAFSNPDNVRTLVNRLQAAGHAAYTRPIQSAQGELVGVFVGPRVDRSAAQRLQVELLEQFQLEGRLVRYEIEEQ